MDCEHTPTAHMTIGVIGDGVETQTAGYMVIPILQYYPMEPLTDLPKIWLTFTQILYQITKVMNKHLFCYIATIVSILIFSGCSNDDPNLGFIGFTKHYEVESTPDSIMSGNEHDLTLDVTADSPDLTQWNFVLANVADFWNHDFQYYQSIENVQWIISGPYLNTSVKNDTLFFDDWLKAYKIWDQGKYKLKVEMRANHSGKMRGARIYVGVDKKHEIPCGELIILQDYIKSEDRPLEVKFRYKDVSTKRNDNQVKNKNL